jgi:hypothetical protein|tara:strand:- start:434 stop:958 length:525 start_codon:yes stop_codon:yes gene_type:complete
MTIKIKIGRQAKEQTVQRKIAVKKSLDGNLMFLSHPHINVVVKGDKNKVLVFAKDAKYTEDAYAAMKRLLAYLADVGLVAFDSIQGGNIYASLEGILEEPAEERSILQLVTFHIGEWLNKENSEVYDEYYQKEVEEYLLDPDDQDSTELGEVPQEADKGVLPKDPLTTPLVYRI